MSYVIHYTRGLFCTRDTLRARGAFIFTFYFYDDTGLSLGYFDVLKTKRKKQQQLYIERYYRSSFLGAL